MIRSVLIQTHQHCTGVVLQLVQLSGLKQKIWETFCKDGSSRFSIRAKEH